MSLIAANTDEKQQQELLNISALVSSQQWLSVFGLKQQKLDFSHILSTIGFKNSDDYVSVLKKPVSSRYSNGMFRKVAHSNGTYYNIIGSREILKKIEKKVQYAVNMYKQRLEWLTSSSRRMFGVIEERCVCVVIDIQEKSIERFQFSIQALKTLIKEQISQLSKFNLVRASSDHVKWQSNCVPVSTESCKSAMLWIQELENVTDYSSTSVLESILDAATDTQVDAIYIYSDGSLCNAGTELLLDKLKDICKPIHVVGMKTKSYRQIQLIKRIAETTLGRFHLYDQEENKTSSNSRSPSSDKNILGLGVRPDVMLIWEELDQARTSLFDVQSILTDLDTSLQNGTTSQVDKSTMNKSSSKLNNHPVTVNEMTLTSKQWLKIHGLKKLNLTVFSFLNGSVFDHCDGVLNIQHPTESKASWVDARYCSKFAHLKWHDDSTKHVHLSEATFRRYKERLLLMLDKYKQRLNWLQKGSRELFGTIVEDKIVLLIDTSSSMSTRLKVVKEKLLQLFQEQLNNKEQFNLIHFDSEVKSWHDHLVTCTSKNLDSAWNWVKTLEANGSTNTLRALQKAYSMSGLQAIYLLTDGRPDQVPEQILSHINKSVPVHCISFNCDDADANKFLYDLASQTGGRYHYFSEDVRTDNDVPRPYQSDDLILLKHEIERGISDLQTMSRLQQECRDIEIAQKERQLRKYTSSTKTHLSIDHKPRPASASGYLTNKASLLRMNPTGPKCSRLEKQRKQHISTKLPSGNATISNTSHNMHLKNILCNDDPTNSSNSSSTQILPKKKRKKKKSSGSKIKQWLNKYGIDAQKLTLLDALGPTLVYSKSKYVPALGKNVVSKVYGETSPIIHAVDHGRSYQIINPQAVDLVWYEERLKECLKLIETKLNSYAFSKISEQLRERFGNGSSLPASFYKLNKSEIDEDIRRQNLESTIKDIYLLEKEINQGEVYLKQSKDLRIMISDIAEEQKKATKVMETQKVPQRPLAEKIQLDDKKSLTNNGRLRYHRVIARSDLDGFYYPALVNKYVNVRYVNLCFGHGESQLTSIRYVISMGGATACPKLSVGDYVLVKCHIKSMRRHDLMTDDSDDYFCYAPGIVQVTPLNMKSASKCYTIIRYNGTKVTSIRKDLLKITRSRFVFTTRFIQELQLKQSQFDTVMIRHESKQVSPDRRRSFSSDSSLQSNNSNDLSHLSSTLRNVHPVKREQNPIPQSSFLSNKDNVSEMEGNNKTASVASINEIPNISDDEEDYSESQSSDDSNNDSERMNSNHISDSENSSTSESDSNSERHNDDGDEQHENDGNDIENENHDENDYQKSKEEIKQKEEQENFKDILDHETNTKFDEWKRFFEEQHAAKIKEIEDQKQLLFELQERLRVSEENQTQRGVLLEKQQQFLQQQQQEFLQRQIEQHNEEQQALKEKYKDLAELQHEIFKQQEKHQTELIKHILDKQQELTPYHQPITIPQAIRVKDQETQLTPREKDQKQGEETLMQSSPIQTTIHDRNFYSHSLPPNIDSVSNNSNDEQLALSGEIPDDREPQVKVFVDPSNEALLMAQGDSGILISRYPPDVDPAVEVRQIPTVLHIDQEVLARFKDDGWYYKGTLIKVLNEQRYFVQDSVGDIEEFTRAEIISDDDDTDHIIRVGDFVVALHPRFACAFAPGIVREVELDGALAVQFFDGQLSVVPRAESYFISISKYERDCHYIRKCENALVGQAVICRDNKTGDYQLAAVRQRLSGTRNYLIEWADQQLDVQNYAYIFGAHTKRPKFQMNCHVLAVSNPENMTYLPGIVLDIQEGSTLLSVQFCDTDSSTSVDGSQAFWISSDFYREAVNYWKEIKKNE